MVRSEGRRLSYSHLASTLALIVAIGGGGVAVAAGLAKNSVGSPHIRAGAVRKPDLAKGSVDGSRVRNNRLTGADIREGTLGRARLARHAAIADQLISAAVSHEGHLLKELSQGATDARRRFIGHYIVTFARTMDGCSFTATIDAHGGVAFAGVMVNVAPGSANDRTVDVIVFSGNGQPEDAPFTIHGIC